MAVKPIRSDVEQIARTRILITSMTIYLLCMGFMALGDRIYDGTPHLVYSRLATVPLFILLVLRWTRLVRVLPPQILRDARQLWGMGRYRAALEAFEKVLSLKGPVVAKIDRSRRLLQNGLSIGVAQEAMLGIGRCRMQLNEVDRAVEALAHVQTQLPRRADIAIELCEGLLRLNRREEAGRVLREALPHMDAVDVQTLGDQPDLLSLLQGAPLPRRSSFHRKILAHRALLTGLIGIAVVHGLHLYLGLF